MPLADGDVPILGEPARAMHVALHAAQHQDGKAVYDLHKAVAQVSEGVWERAAEVAARLDALPAFAAGLRLDEAGTVLLERLGLSQIRNARTELRAGQVPLAESLNELLETEGAGAKLRFAAAEIFPKPRFMRWWSPLARHGAIGIAASYVWRPIYIIVHMPAAVRAVWRARHVRRESEGSG
jgi:hypothetical protein